MIYRETYVVEVSAKAYPSKVLDWASRRFGKSHRSRREDPNAVWRWDIVESKLGDPICVVFEFDKRDDAMLFTLAMGDVVIQNRTCYHCDNSVQYVTIDGD